MGMGNSYNKDSIARARLSLDGLSVGDALGGFYEFGTAERLSHIVEQRQVPNVTWHYTDDTSMALSIYESLRQHSEVDQEAVARSFIQHYELSRGYGRAPGLHAAPMAKTGGMWPKRSSRDTGFLWEWERHARRTNWGLFRG